MPRVKTFDEKEVLQKAIELFWAKGYNATSINDLVDHLGLSRSSLYDTYGDKHDLFEKAFEQYQSRNIASLKNYLASQPNVRQGFLQLFTQAIDSTLEDPDHKGCLMVNTTTEMVPGDEPVREKLIANRRLLENMFEDYIRQGINTGELSEGLDVPAIASLLFTFQNGLNVTAKINPDRNALIRSVEAALKILDQAS